MIAQKLPDWWVSVEAAREFEHWEFPRGYRADAHDGRYWFDADASAKAINFAPMFLRHTKGANGPLILEEWQQAILATLFGWKRKDNGMRRYRIMYMEVGRGNGKSTLCVVIAALLMFVDGEHGAEIIGAAFTRQQAREVFDVFRTNMQASEPLSPVCDIMRDSVCVVDPSTGINRAVYKIVSADGDANQGGNLHGVIVDELHVQKTRWFWDTLRGSTIKRRQPLTVAITTAGTDRESICFEQRLYGEEVCRNPIGDEAMAEFLPVIYAADPKDDWISPTTWRKANPNIDISITEEDIRKECLKAQKSPGYRNTFKRLHCNIWTAQSVLCLNMESWDECGDIMPADAVGMRKRWIEELRGQECYAGLDMAQRSDVAALALWFPESSVVLPWFWVPQEMVEKRRMNPSNLGRYEQWASQGFMETTEGSWVSEATIQQTIIDLSRIYRISKLLYDPWNADATRVKLEENGIECVSIPQTMKNLSAPFKRVKELIDTRTLNHLGNPVLRWMAQNTAEITDTNANAKPCKKRSVDKVDGIVALTMGVLGELAFSDDGLEAAYTYGDLRA